MAEMIYRVHKSKIAEGQSLGGNGKVVRVIATADGLSVEEVPITQLRVVRNLYSGLIGWQASVFVGLTVDPDDEEYILVETHDQVFPMSFVDNPDDPAWQDAAFIPKWPDVNHPISG